MDVIETRVCGLQCKVLVLVITSKLKVLNREYVRRALFS